MTSRSILGGNEQSIGSLHREQVRSSQFEFKTWCSASAELAPSPRPQAMKVLPSVARSAQQEDRASILDRICVLGVVVAGLIGGACVILGFGYWFV